MDICNLTKLNEYFSKFIPIIVDINDYSTKVFNKIVDIQKLNRHSIEYMIEDESFITLNILSVDYMFHIFCTTCDFELSIKIMKHPCLHIWASAEDFSAKCINKK